MYTTKSQLAVLEELDRREQHQAFIHRDGLRDALGLDERAFDAALEPLLDEHMVDAVGSWVTLMAWGREAVRKKHRE